MDFHTLSRKELQTLCKKNKIPANITNVAMADALAALQHVEGLDEFLNQREGDSGTPGIHHRTACRTSTQRKPVREGSEVRVSARPQRGNKAVIAEEVVEQENKDSDDPVTPAVVPGSRTRAPAVYARRKKEAEMVEADDNQGQGNPTEVLITPAAAPTSRTRATGRSVRTRNETPAGTSVQPVYNTRRSVRLLQKTLSKISLVDTEELELDKIDDVSEELSNDSQQVEDSSETEKGSTAVSDNTNELEVSSLDKTDDNECQSHDSGSDVKLVSGTENDIVGLQAEADDEQKEEDLGIVDLLEVELRDPNLKLEGSFDTCDDSNEAGSELLSEVEEYGDSSELETEPGDSPVAEVSGDAFIEVTDVDVAAAPVVVPHDASMDAANQDVTELLCEVGESGDSSELETEPDDLPVEVSGDAFMEVTDVDVAAVPVVVPDDATMDAANQDVTGSSVSPKGSDEKNESENLNVANGNYFRNFEPMYGVDVEAADEKGFASSEGVLPLGSSTLCSSVEHQEEELEVKPEQSDESREEIEKMDHASDVTCESSSILDLEGDASSENSLADTEVCTESKPEQSEESMTDTNEMDDASDVTGASAAIPAAEVDAKDAGAENSVAVIEVCTKSSAIKKESMDAENVTLESLLLDVGAHEPEDQKDNSSLAVIEVCTESSANEKESMEAENVTLESLLLDVGAHEPEDQKDNSEKLGAEAQAEESVGCAEGEDTAEILLTDQQVCVESAGSSIDSCSSGGLESVISCSSNTLVDGGDISDYITIQEQESRASAETITLAPIHELKSSYIPIESVVSDQPKGDMNNANMMKENLTSDELNDMSMGQLRKMLKNLTLDSKSNCKTINVVKGAERKRNALQALPQNQMTKGEAQIDG